MSLTRKVSPRPFRKLILITELNFKRKFRFEPEKFLCVNVMKKMSEFIVAMQFSANILGMRGENHQSLTSVLDNKTEKFTLLIKILFRQRFFHTNFYSTSSQSSPQKGIKIDYRQKWKTINNFMNPRKRRIAWVEEVQIA